MSKQAVKSFDQYISLAKELRDAFSKAKIAFYDLLCEFEQSGTWQQAGFLTFDQLMKEHRLGRLESFRNYIAATKSIGHDTILRIGADAAIVGAGIADDEKRSKFVRSMILHAEESGFPPSGERAREVRQEVAPEERLPANIIRLSREQAKIQELTKAVETLRERVKQLESENRDLRSKLAKTAKTRAA